jgi:hypothetical protein
MTTTFSTKALLRVHRYAGLIAAPLVLFFAVSGIWQVFRLQDTRKDGSYTAPKALAVASDLHKAEDLKAAGAMGLAFKVSISTIGVILTTTTLLGIVVALRVTRPRWLAILLLLVGAALPPILYFLAT